MGMGMDGWMGGWMDEIECSDTVQVQVSDDNLR